jgi:hypothetical protein
MTASADAILASIPPTIETWNRGAELILDTDIAKGSALVELFEVRSSQIQAPRATDAGRARPWSRGIVMPLGAALSKLLTRLADEQAAVRLVILRRQRAQRCDEEIRRST